MNFYDILFWIIAPVAPIGALVDWYSSLGLQYWVSTPTGDAEASPFMRDSEGNYAEKRSLLVSIGLAATLLTVWFAVEQAEYRLMAAIVLAFLGLYFLVFGGLKNLKDRKKAYARMSVFLDEINEGVPVDYRFTRNLKKEMYSPKFPFFRSSNPSDEEAVEEIKWMINRLAQEKRERWTDPAAMEAVQALMTIKND